LPMIWTLFSDAMMSFSLETRAATGLRFHYEVTLEYSPSNTGKEPDKASSVSFANS